MTDYLARLCALQASMSHHGIDSAILAATDHMRYLVGWAETGHERLLVLHVPASGAPRLIVPAINAEQARRNQSVVADVVGWDDADGWADMAAELLGRCSIVAVDEMLPAGHLLMMQESAPDVRWRPASAVMSELREAKSVDELGHLRRAARITDRVYVEVVAKLREGVSEADVCSWVDAAHLRHGAQPTFAIVCFGENSALPHHHSGDRQLREGDTVILDIGCSVDGYNSDITRTVAFGRADPLAAEIYQVVLRAHLAAEASVRPGATCEGVDAAARAVIAAAGYGDQFIHRTGHGIGLSGHEPPYIVAGNAQPLKPGMCFSNEPGVYLPGRFGVRIENIVAVTEAGVEVLNVAAPELLPVVLPEKWP